MQEATTVAGNGRQDSLTTKIVPLLSGSLVPSKPHLPGPGAPQAEGRGRSCMAFGIAFAIAFALHYACTQLPFYVTA